MKGWSKRAWAVRNAAVSIVNTGITSGWVSMFESTPITRDGGTALYYQPKLPDGVAVHVRVALTYTNILTFTVYKHQGDVVPLFAFKATRGANRNERFYS